jgi:hypothetical protein
MDLSAMMTSIFSKPDLLKTFLPLSESGNTFLEIMLVNPKTSKAEGRGFFNDTDFLLEACKPLIGRYNFCLSNFGFAQEQIPTRGSYNQFDRALTDMAIQDQARVHSISIAMLFKPELIREMTSQAGNVDQFQNIIYQIDAILSRMGMKSYSVDYFLTGVVLRFWPAGTLRARTLNKAALALVTRHMIETVEKKMTPQEHKRFALASSISGKLWDPVPGLPGMFAGDGSGSMIAASFGNLEPPEDAVFASLLEDVFEPKKKPEKDAYSTPNIQGLSQNWQEVQEAQFETAPSQGLQHEKSFTSDKEEYADPQTQANAKELVAYFQGQSQGKWRWPLYSAAFNRLHKGAACGDMLLLQCDPFAAELGFQFLMQCTESFNKEGTGQILIFSKKRTLGDMALASLSRHYKTNPLTSKSPSAPDAATLAKSYGALFPNPPQMPPCNRGDGLEHLLKYVEHDYLLKQKKRGTALMPLAIVIDNLAEFSQEDEAETFRRLSLMKMRLREFNGSLWVTQIRSAADPAPQACLALADYLLAVDHDGALEAVAAGKPPLPARPSDWESGFHAEFSAEMLIQEFSLLKIRFQAHGSHRSFLGHYAYHRPSSLFQEISPPPAQASAPAQATARPASPPNLAQLT